MNKKVDFPQDALPLSDELLNRVRGFESKELYWLSGYCSGLADAKLGGVIVGENLPQAVASSAVTLKTVVLYASQSGNAEQLAGQLHQSLTQKGLQADLASTAEFKANKLKEQQVILMVASTHGEGEPPDDAMDFHEFILGKRAPKLSDVKHAVLSLGDSSYEFFCQTGKDFDQAFTKLGSSALIERLDCDLDYEQAAADWIAKVVDKIAELSGSQAASTAAEVPASLAKVGAYSKEKPFTATILENQKITGRGSVKNIHHIEISLEGSGISYQPGDSLGVWAKNNVDLVTEIIQLSGLQGDEPVVVKDANRTLREALTENLEVTLLNKTLISEYVELVGDETLKKQLKEIALDNFSDFINNHQLVDLLVLAPVKFDAQQLVDLLKPIKPRMYSIASSLEANPEEVHLTVALAESINAGGTRKGAASQFLLETLQEDDEVLVFVDANKHFKLPENNKPIIMIGPGTGIAPFRAFLQQRQEESATGKNWLFFGNPNFNTDFLYQTEWQGMLKEGVLNEISLAFSRDQENKIYVQDKLLENAETVWRWISEEQAAIYVCGDMSRMAKDVEQALLTIIQKQGNRSEDDAKAFLKQLKQDKKYQRDVY